MPMYEMGLPVSSSNLKITHNGVDYSLVLGTETFVRVGKDGDESTLPLCGGDEYVGESLEGQWKKAWGADITPFTARINGGILELGGKYDGAGADPDGWINGHHPIPLMNELEVTVELESPTNDTAEGASGNIKTEFYIRQDKAVNSPDDDDNYLKISIDVTAAGLLMEVIEEIGGTPNTIFNGSTHDDAVGRSLTAEKFTVWRIVFHDGVAGADSPEDVRHIHIHLKQGVDRATAEDATENQLTTSPYAIDDYLFNVGYPAFRIYTTDTTFFGSAVGSGAVAMSTYLRTSYPALFALKYDFTDADYGKGDVELWDGDPDSDGVRVYDEDHEFINDAYLQNSLLRLLIDYKANPVQYGLKLFGYYGAAWVQPFDQLWFHAVTSTEDLQFPTIRHIESISPEKVAIVVRLLDTATVDDDYYIDVRITLERGRYSLKIDSLDVFPDQDVRFWFLNTTTLRFGYVQDDDVGDDDIDEDGDNATPTDNFLIAFDDDEEAVLGVVFTDEDPAGGNARFFAEDGGDLSIEDVDAVDTAGTIIWVSLIPFTLIANLFIEAEAGDYTGTTPGNDANASPPAGNNYVLLDLTGDFQTLAGEYSTYQFNAGTDLPEGRYRAIIRARYEDEETMRMYVWQDTANEYRNEENAKVTKTLAATFGYHSVVFDITAADVSGTRPFVIVAEKSTADTDKIRIDYMLVVPIGDGESFPQDVSHSAMRDLTKPRRLYVR